MITGFSITAEVFNQLHIQHIASVLLEKSDDEDNDDKDVDPDLGALRAAHATQKEVWAERAVGRVRKRIAIGWPEPFRLPTAS